VLLATLAPVVAAAALWIVRTPNRSEHGALVLSSSWVLVGTFAVNAIAIEQRWWSYADDMPALLGMSLPLLLGWVALWGVFAPLLGFGVVRTTIALAIVDLVAMPLLDPAVVLGERWLLGEFVLLVVVAAPAVAIARAQALSLRETVRPRLVAQLVLFSVVLLWLVPAVARNSASLPSPSPWWFGVILGSIGLAALPGTISLVEFGLHGGTPWPWDRTERPIRSGPYRYVRSPMQSSGMALLLVLACLYRSPGLGLAAASTVAWSTWFCRTEAPVLSERWGDAWQPMALEQRRWIPSWRPHRGSERAILWVDLDCDVCANSTLPIIGEHAIGLEIRHAAQHVEVLERLRYERADGVSCDGVAAYGAALEHVNLALAVAGWLLRLPILSHGAQIVADAFGMGPRPARSFVAETPKVPTLDP